MMPRKAGVNAYKDTINSAAAAAAAAWWADRVQLCGRSVYPKWCSQHKTIKAQLGLYYSKSDRVTCNSQNNMQHTKKNLGSGIWLNQSDPNYAKHTATIEAGSDRIEAQKVFHVGITDKSCPGLRGYIADRGFISSKDMPSRLEAIRSVVGVHDLLILFERVPLP